MQRMSKREMRWEFNDGWTTIWIGPGAVPRVQRMWLPLVERYRDRTASQVVSTTREIGDE